MIDRKALVFMIAVLIWCLVVAALVAFMTKDSVTPQDILSSATFNMALVALYYTQRGRA